MAYFPMYIDLEGKKVIVVGGGKVALRKINSRAKIGKGTIEKMSELGILDGMPETNQLSLFDFM